MALMLFAASAQAQTTISTGHIANNGNATITFNVQNTNVYPITVTTIQTYLYFGSQNWRVLYNTNAVNSSGSSWTQGTINAGVNGWIQAASGTLNATVDGIKNLGPTAITIPAGATFGFCVSTSSLGYMSLGFGVNTFTAAGVNIKTGDNIGWGAAALPSTPGNYPRGFVGGITFITAPQPVVSSFLPTTATTGDTVTITGANFTGATAVAFGGTSATSFLVVNDTTIMAVVAAGSTGSVSVTNTTGTASSNGFTYCISNTYFADSDGDGFGNPEVSYLGCAQAGYVLDNTDCNDADGAVHESYPFYIDADADGFGFGTAVMLCAVNAMTPPVGYALNNTDCNDADGAVHESYPFYVDADADGFGFGTAVMLCAVNAMTPPVGYALNNTDCNDADGAVHESYPFYVDADADGFGFGTAVMLCAVNAMTPPAGYVLNNTDCNDSNGAVHASYPFYVDADADGFGFGTAVMLCAVNAMTPPAGYAANSLDCNDAQVRYQDLDNDGFGSVIKVPCGGRTNKLDCNDNLLTYRDLDGDGYGVNVLVACGVTNNTDCNDSNALVYQSTALFVDADGDGYTSGQSLVVCYGATLPSGFALTNIGIDCNDNFAAINPGAAEVPYNGIDDDCDLLIDEGFPLLTTSLLPGICNTTLASIGSLIGITTLPSSSLITGYRIRATNGAQVQIIERGAPHFTMQMFGSYNYATTYTIDIELQRNGVWLGYYGPTCQISTPAILAEGGASAVSALQCGITLPKINTLIATTSIQGVTGYRFRITNLTDLVGPNPVQTVTRTLNWFTLQMLTRYNYGTTYRIEVAVKTTGDFGGYGSPCEISSPPSPSLTNCEATIATNNTIIACASLAGVSQYRFQVTRDSDGASTTIDRSSNYFTFSSVPPAIFSAGALYNVRIAVMSLGTWSPFGDICQITAPGLASKQEAVSPEMDQNDFKAVASPNPFTSDFGINLTTSSQENVVIKVYDLLGRLVESTEVKVPDLNNTKLGAQYPAGIYNVIATQSGIVKVLRIIKR